MGGVAAAFLLSMTGCAVAIEQPELAIVTTTFSPAQMCAALAWPQPTPALIGQRFDRTLPATTACFFIATALTPDGRNIALEPAVVDSSVVVA
ncbi:hypothetical protein [Nocardia sp. NPDC060259]|uniref:hypothetical protein n=1 Tax=Nocardia sp. NPDC060259 TaxID=3347088 RepID=UPI003657B85C